VEVTTVAVAVLVGIQLAILGEMALRVLPPCGVVLCAAPAFDNEYQLLGKIVTVGTQYAADLHSNAIGFVVCLKRDDLGFHGERTL
jgi:hypothetical protein